MFVERDEIVKKSFYLTSLFADIKSEHNWTTNETKMTLLMLSELDQYKIYLPDFDNFDSSIGEYKKTLKNIPTSFSFTRKQFIDITGVRTEHAAREIKKTVKGLLSKIIITPHPLYPDDPNSLEGITWFTKINYSNGDGIINVKMNEDAIERLIAFVKYTNIRFENIIKLQNQYAIFTYIILKILIDSSKINHIEITVDDFKEKVGCSKKYKYVKDFRKYVLEVIDSEINKNTDIDFDYELVKKGRSYSNIKFNFNYKVKTNKKPEIIAKVNNKLNQGKQKAKDEKLPKDIEAILVSWGIKKEPTIKEWSTEYSKEAFQKSIDITLDAISKGNIKKTPAGYFKKVLENKKWEENYLSEQKEIEAKKEKKRREDAKKSKEYDELYSFVLSNEDIISSVLTTHYKHLPIINRDAIPIFKKLKSLDADRFIAYKNTPVVKFYYFETDSYVESTLSDLIDRSQYIDIADYKDDMEIIESYKKALGDIKNNEYLTDNHKGILVKEIQQKINLLLEKFI